MLMTSRSIFLYDSPQLRFKYTTHSRYFCILVCQVLYIPHAWKRLFWPLKPALLSLSSSICMGIIIQFGIQVTDLGPMLLTLINFCSVCLLQASQCVSPLPLPNLNLAVLFLFFCVCVFVFFARTSELRSNPFSMLLSLETHSICTSNISPVSSS